MRVASSVLVARMAWVNIFITIASVSIVQVRQTQGASRTDIVKQLGYAQLDSQPWRPYKDYRTAATPASFNGDHQDREHCKYYGDEAWLIDLWREID